MASLSAAARVLNFPSTSLHCLTIDAQVPLVYCLGQNTEKTASLYA